MNQAVCALRLHCIVVASFQYGGENNRNRQTLTEHSVKARPFLFPFTIGKFTSIYCECVKVFFCTYLSRILCFTMTNASKGFLVSNLRPVFEKVKFDVRLSLEPFKDLDGRFDPSSTALTKRSQTLSNDTCVSRILSAGV